MLGIEELEIAVADYNWSLRHRQITSLNLKYLASWNMALRLVIKLYFLLHFSLVSWLSIVL